MKQSEAKKKKIREFEERIRKLRESVCEHTNLRIYGWTNPDSGSDENVEYKCGSCGKLYEREEYVRWCVDQLRTSAKDV